MRDVTIVLKETKTLNFTCGLNIINVKMFLYLKCSDNLDENIKNLFHESSKMDYVSALHKASNGFFLHKDV
jgi:hypothetical protein